LHSVIIRYRRRWTV